MLLALTAITSTVLGLELTLRIWRKDSEGLPSWQERALYAFLIGSSLWLGSTWALALPHLLGRGPLITRTAVFFVAAAAMMVWRLRRTVWDRPVELKPVAVALVGLALLPLFLWIYFALWRGMVTPPASIDGLAYHLPRAVLFARAEGYDALRAVRFLIAWRPANYELLLADAMTMDGSDRMTEWIATYFYCGFVISAAALAARWRSTKLIPTLTAALLAGSVPVALLHSAEYKNDVMAAFFATAALVAISRWLSQRDLASLVLSVVALTAAAGTKIPAALFAVLGALCLIWPFVRRRVPIAPRRFVAIAVLCLVAVLLLGGAAYGTRVHDRFTATVDSPNTTSYSTTAYGHFANLWKAPVVFITAPFSRDPLSLHVPWASKPWVWHRYEMYYSELGILFAVCLAAFPFCLVKLGKRVRADQLVLTAIAIVSFTAILPFDGVPIGRYLLGLPRFALTIVPVVVAWTAVPFAVWLESRSRAAAVALVAIAAGSFVWYGVKNAVHDTFAPLGYVMWASEHPGTRLPPIARGRAAAVLDERAGPRDRVAFDGGISAVLHFAYGRDLRRRVDLIPPGAGAPAIADDVQWVVIDRAWSTVWGNVKMTDLGDAAGLIGSGEPTADDLRVLKAMLADKRFRLVFSYPERLQAVFQRDGRPQSLR